MDMMQNIYNPIQPNSPYSIFSTPNFGIQQQIPRMDIIKVNGKNGAEKFEMAPNSSALLLDMNDPLIWFVQTDGAGYKTCLPYSITPYEPPKELDVKAMFNQLTSRLDSIEERMQKNESNNVIAKQSSKSSVEFNL